MTLARARRALPASAVAVVGVVTLLALAGALPSATASSAPKFASEKSFPGGGAYWEPTVAVDPGNPAYVYQAVTYVNASKICLACPGTAVFVRASSDGGASWGKAHPIYTAGGQGWQFDPQLRVSTNGTVYAVFLQTFKPGSVLFKSTDHGATWKGPFTMNGALTYNDKPILVISPTGRNVYVAFNVKLASYVAVSHNYGYTFALEQTSNESLWWYTYGGAYAPDGSVYFAQAGESGNKSTGKTTNQGHVGGPDKMFVLKLHPDGSVAADSYLGESATPTPCVIPACYVDYFAAQSAVAADSAGGLMVAYTFNAQNASPHHLYIRTSTNGALWSRPITVNQKGDSNFPAIVSGPTAGDFRLAWQDNRNSPCWNCGGLGDWETWYSRTTDNGASWSPAVPLSNLGSGAPYKAPLGYEFTDGDYFGFATSPSGTNYVIWGEADGSSIYCCGGAWYTQGE